jgi:hypothetical protein
VGLQLIHECQELEVARKMWLRFEHVAWNCKVADTVSIHGQVQLRVLVVTNRTTTVRVHSALVPYGVQPLGVMSTEQGC